MKKIRRVCLIVPCLYAVLITLVIFLFGKLDNFSIILLFMNYFILIINFISYKRESERIYKIYEKGFKYLKFVHKERYKLYLIGSSKEKIERYSTELERCGTMMLDEGKYIISNNLLTKKNIKKIQEMMEQTKKMMTTIS